MSAVFSSPAVPADVAISEDSAPIIASGFASLGLHDHVMTGVTQAGYTEPTTVQAAAMPVVAAGLDAIVSSQTGSGKTAAFMLPALSRIAVTRDASPLESAMRGGRPRVLVLAPTRELADQSMRAASTYGRALRRLSVLSVVGGMPYREQLQRLSRPVDVLVATPGRLIDHLQRGRVDLSGLDMLVLDEADRMLDMGFIEDIETIVAATPASRQTLLFSATIDSRIQKLAAKWMRDPQRIDVTSQAASAPNIDERLYLADDMQHKDRLLDHLLADTAVQCAIVFAATKRETEDLANRLYEKGHASAALHGDMQQRFRTKTLNALRRGEVRVLVATDVAARGIDVAEISHVVNFDLPMQAEDYVHRIGRTGRAGREGTAVTFATGREIGKVKGIERFTRRPLPVHTMPGLEPRTRFQSAAAAPTARRRSSSWSKPGSTDARRPAAGDWARRSSAPRPADSWSDRGSRAGAGRSSRGSRDY